MKAFLWITFLGKQNTIDVFQRRCPFYSLPLCCVTFVVRILKRGTTFLFTVNFLARCGAIFNKASLHMTMLELVEDLVYQWGRGLKGMRENLCSLYLARGCGEKGTTEYLGIRRGNLRLVIDSIISETSSWVLVNNDFKHYSLNDMMRNWVTCILVPLHWKHVLVLEWVPPLDGKVKVNFDGALLGNLGLAGYGCVMRDF